MIRNLFSITRSSVSNQFTGITRSFAAIVESIATYEEVKDLPNRPEALLIDVREPKELQETGVIPTSINIPLASLKETFTSELAKVEFKTKYGRKFPKLDDEIIFTCRSGLRAQTAVDIANQLGFKNSRNYKGSWLEWAAKEGLKSN